MVCRTYLKINLSAHGGVAGRLKVLTLPCMLRFFAAPRLALNPNLVLEIGSGVILRLLSRLNVSSDSSQK